MSPVRGLQITGFQQFCHGRMLKGLRSDLAGLAGLQEKAFAAGERHEKGLLALVGDVHEPLGVGVGGG